MDDGHSARAIASSLAACRLENRIRYTDPRNSVEHKQIKEHARKLMLGVIANDVTGATDIASTLVNQGLRVMQLPGVCGESFDPCEAQVIFNRTDI